MSSRNVSDGWSGSTVGTPSATAVPPLSSRTFAAAAHLDAESATGSEEGETEPLETAQRHIRELLVEDLFLREKLAELELSLEKARAFGLYDELTGLPNRRLLLDHFNQAAARATRRNNEVALLFLDLDGFKRVNDALGHTIGDRLLQEVAARLKSCIRASDTACRLGGDEFVVLLPELDGRGSALAAAEHIRAKLASPYILEARTITISASIGIAVYPHDAESYDDLLRLSDSAMYREKELRAVRYQASGGNS